MAWLTVHHAHTSFLQNGHNHELSFVSQVSLQLWTFFIYTVDLYLGVCDSFGTDNKGMYLVYCQILTTGIFIQVQIGIGLI